MPFIIPFIPLIAAGIIGGTTIAASSGGGSSSSGSSGNTSDGSSTSGGGAAVDINGNPIKDNAIVPGKVPPTYPGIQGDWGTWLSSQIGQGATPYPGPTSPSTSSTILPNVANSWQPWDSGMGYISNALYGAPSQGGLGVGTNSSILDQLRQYGGGSGPGTKQQIATSQWGAPTPESAYYASNLAQYGISDKGAGQPLVDLAYGRTTGPSQYLLPFLTSGTSGATGYKAPAIPAKTITRS